MAKTSLSSATSYCSATEYKDFCDWRAAAELFSDTEVRLTEAALATNTKFANLLLAASGELEAFALKGERYTAEDLAALEGASAQLLKRVVAKLTEARAIQRRPDKGGYQLTSAHQEIIGPGGWLDKLGSGELIFAFSETADAGHMTHELMTEAETTDRNDIIYQARRYFGRRSNRPR